MVGNRSVPCRHRAGFVANPSTYFEILEPLEANGLPPVMMIAGGGHSGACYLITPDGRPGWAHAFLRCGYRVVLVDWPGVGRSGFVPPEDLCGRLIVDGLANVLNSLGEPAVLMTHSISGAFGWKMLEENSPAISALIGVAPASPGNLGKQLGVLVRDEGTRKRVNMPSGETVIDLGRTLNFPPEFHRAKLVGSSTRFPAEAMESYFQSLLGVAGRIVFERTNIGGGQLRVGDTSGFSNKPVLVVTGTEDTDHSRALDGEIVEWLIRAGARAEFLYLGDLGIEGNGHMMMLEQNSDETAKTIMSWLETSLGGEIS